MEYSNDVVIAAMAAVGSGGQSSVTARVLVSPYPRRQVEPPKLSSEPPRQLVSSDLVDDGHRSV